MSLSQNHASTTAADSSSNPSATALPRQPAEAHLPDVAGNRLVNSAQLVENASHSEMRIELQTDKLGSVELRAHIAGDEVGAAITVEKRDAHAALAVELPALQQALSTKQLRVDQVTLLQGSLNSAAGNAGRDARQQQAPMPNRFQTSTGWISAGTHALFSPVEAVSSGIFDIQGRLNVHA
jgi:flagellar hook-length control protein FliK